MKATKMPKLWSIHTVELLSNKKKWIINTGHSMNEPQDNYVWINPKQYVERKKATHTQTHKKDISMTHHIWLPRISKISNTM